MPLRKSFKQSETVRITLPTHIINNVAADDCEVPPCFSKHASRRRGSEIDSASSNANAGAAPRAAYLCMYL